MELLATKGISLIAIELLGYLQPTESAHAVTIDVRFNWRWMCGYLLSLMADGRLTPKRMVTHRFGYGDMVQAYEMALLREKEMLSVVFRWKEQ